MTETCWALYRAGELILLSKRNSPGLPLAGASKLLRVKSKSKVK